MRNNIKKHFADSPITLLGLASGEQMDWPEPEKLKAAIEAAKAHVIRSNTTLKLLMALTLVLVLALTRPGFAAGPSWKAGLAKTRITPDKSLWMGGFGARTNTSSGTLQELYAKALALDDGSGRPAVLVTTGYNNDVFAYIPSRRVLQEGGYEGGGAILGARLPGPFAPTVEETIVRKVHELVERVRTK